MVIQMRNITVLVQKLTVSGVIQMRAINVVIQMR